MPVTVLIRRTVLPENEKLVGDLYIKLSSVASRQKGYIDAKI